MKFDIEILEKIEEYRLDSNPKYQYDTYSTFVDGKRLYAEYFLYNKPPYTSVNWARSDIYFYRLPRVSISPLKDALNLAIQEFDRKRVKDKLINHGMSEEEAEKNSNTILKI